MSGDILVPIDFSEATEPTVAEAARLARAFGAKVWLIHVAELREAYVAGSDLGPVNLRQNVARELRAEHRKLQTEQEKLAQQGLEATALLVPGVPAEKILEQARRLGPRYIVLGSHGHGALYHLLMGSVSERVLRQAPCPVVLVPRRGAGAAE